MDKKTVLRSLKRFPETRTVSCGIAFQVTSEWQPVILWYIRNYNCNDTGNKYQSCDIYLMVLNDTGLMTSSVPPFWSDLALLYLDCWSSPHTTWFIDLLRSLPTRITLWSCEPTILYINWFNISVKISYQQRNCTWKTSVGIQNFIPEDGLVSLTYSQPLERLAMKYQIICFEVFFSTFERLFSMM